MANITAALTQLVERLTAVDALLATPANCPYPVTVDAWPRHPSLSSDDGPQHQEAFVLLSVQVLQ